MTAFLPYLGILIAVIYFKIVITTLGRKKSSFFIMMWDFVQKFHVSVIV